MVEALILPKSGIHDTGSAITINSPKYAVLSQSLIVPVIQKVPGNFPVFFRSINSKYPQRK